MYSHIVELPEELQEKVSNRLNDLHKKLPKSLGERKFGSNHPTNQSIGIVQWIMDFTTISVKVFPLKNDEFINWILHIRSRFARNLTNLFKSYKYLLKQLHFINDTCLGVALIPFGIKTIGTEIDNHAKRQVR